MKREREMTMAKITITALEAAMDQQARASGDAKCWWNTASLILTVWSNCRDGWFPVVPFDPRNNKDLEGLALAYKQFGADLLSVANSRAFG